MLTSYKGNGLTIGGDALIPFHPTDYLKRLSYSTNPWAGFGSELPPIFSIPPLPDVLIFSAFDLLCIDIYLSNKLYLLILAMFSAFSMYYFGTTIFQENKNRQLIGFAAAISYLYNPWVISDTYKSMVFSQLSLAQSGLILFLALTIVFFRTRKIKYAIFSGIATFLMLSTPGLGAYQYGLIALIGYSCVALYHVRLSSRNLPRLITGCLITVALALIINSYWLIPFISNLNFYVSFASNFQITTVFNKSSILLNTLRLMNAWGFSEFAPYSRVYFTNPLIIFLTFSWPVFAFAPLLFNNVRKSLKMSVIYLISLTTILIACGSNPPLGSLYVDIVNAHLGSFYFLKPFYTTGAVTQHALTLEYAILIGLFSSLTYSKLKKFFGRILIPRIGIIAILLILIVSTWPIVTGEVMRNWYSSDQYGVHIPNYYWEANDQLEKTCDLKYKTLLLPPTQIYVGTSWGYQGSSQFYNLMFNFPLITGNEIPYGITTNKTLVDQIYSIPYIIPDVNRTLDVMTQTGRIIAWQGDKVTLANAFLQIDFNNTYLISKWHQVELRLLSADNWSSFTHMIIQFTGELRLDHLQIGIGDVRNDVGWWATQNCVCLLENGTFVSTETGTLITQDNGTVTLLMNIEKPDRSSYLIDNVTSLWIQYLVTDPSHTATLQINKVQVVKASIDVQYYANLLEKNNIKYLLVDLAIKDGAKNDPQLWLQVLSNSKCFKVIWQKETLYIFENITF